MAQLNSYLESFLRSDLFCKLFSILKYLELARCSIGRLYKYCPCWWRSIARRIKAIHAKLYIALSHMEIEYWLCFRLTRLTGPKLWT